MSTPKPIVCIATGTRADWGLLLPVANELRARGHVDVRILATNMHLLEGYGNTLDEVSQAGFPPATLVPIYADNSGAEPTDALSRAQAMGVCLKGAAEAFDAMKPAAVVILGDRYEMLAVASAAAMMRIPIAHLCGGEVTEGAIDDKLRHAITKLASIHLTATEVYRKRVIQMGEDADTVFNIGAPGVWNLMNQTLMMPEEFFESVSLPPDQPFAVVTYHPATMDDGDPGELCEAMFRALDQFPNLNLLVTYPNNDAGSQRIIDTIKAEARRQPGRIHLVKSLGMQRYLAAITYAEVVIGNSSSGIIEVPAAGTPVVNIGSRQKGRLHSRLVIDCGDTTDQIAKAIKMALDPVFIISRAFDKNPYSCSNTPTLAAIAIEYLAKTGGEPKHFHDIDFEI